MRLIKIVRYWLALPLLIAAVVLVWLVRVISGDEYTVRAW